LGLKILKFFVADPDPGSGAFLTLDPVVSRIEKLGSGMKKFESGIRDEHLGSATLQKSSMIS
jgi:hypothetical protein